MIMPTNLRFKFYETKEEVKMENKYTAIPLTVPLTENMQGSYQTIKNTTKDLKRAIAYLYAIYLMNFSIIQFMPRSLHLESLMQLSKKYTLSFSNVAGLVKPVKCQGPKGGKIITNISTQSYI